VEQLVKPKTGSRRKILQDETPREVKAGDNGPDSDTILLFAGQLRAEKAKVKLAQKRLGMVRKCAINAGLVMQELQEVMADAELEPEAVAAKYARRKQYADALQVPIGTQLSIFEARAAGGVGLSHTEQCEKAYHAGYARGIMGEFPDEQAYPKLTEFGSHHEQGWTAGQAKLHERWNKIEAEIEAASAPKKAPEPPAPDNDNAEAPEGVPLQ
jgi:hypothetical protein